METNLGRVIATHRGTFSAGGLLWYLGGLFGFAGVAGLVSSLIPSAGSKAHPSVWVGAAGVCVGGLMLLTAVQRLRQTVEVFEHGFVWKRLWGTRVVPRSEIIKSRLLTTNGGLATVTAVILTLVDHEELELEGFDNPDQLSNLLSPASVPAAVTNAVSTHGGWRPPNS